MPPWASAKPSGPKDSQPICLLAIDAKRWPRTVNEDSFDKERRELTNKEMKDQRAWFDAALRDGELIATLYWVKGIDLEEDLGHFALRYAEHVKASKEASEFDKALLVNDLKTIWRRQLGRFSWGSALKTGRALEGLESRTWRWWRGINWWMPRIMMAVGTGFLLITGMGDVGWFMEEITKPHHSWWKKWVVWFLCGMVAFVVALWEVQQRIGRRPWPQILFRTLLLWGFGGLYATAGGLTLDQLRKWALAGKDVTVIVSWSLAAFMLAFVLQLFWQDKSAGEGL